MLSNNYTTHYNSAANRAQNYDRLVGIHSVPLTSAAENENIIGPGYFKNKTYQPALNWTQNSNGDLCVGDLYRYGRVPIPPPQRPCAPGKTYTEKGLVTLLRPTYGFITPRFSNYCLFFHYNNVIGNGPNPDFGDLVQYQRSFDKIARKEMATNVIILNRQKLVSEERGIGQVVSVPAYTSFIVQPGLIRYIVRKARTYFIQYYEESVENSSRLFEGDRVSFHFAANSSGILCAHSIRLLTPSVVMFNQ